MRVVATVIIISLVIFLTGCQGKSDISNLNTHSLVDEKLSTNVNDELVENLKKEIAEYKKRISIIEEKLSVSETIVTGQAKQLKSKGDIITNLEKELEKNNSKIIELEEMNKDG